MPQDAILPLKADLFLVQTPTDSAEEPYLEIPQVLICPFDQFPEFLRKLVARLNLLPGGFGGHHFLP
jgi:hypothetical protein